MKFLIIFSDFSLSLEVTPSTEKNKCTAISMDMFLQSLLPVASMHIKCKMWALVFLGNKHMYTPTPSIIRTRGVGSQSAQSQISESKNESFLFSAYMAT